MNNVIVVSHIDCETNVENYVDVKTFSQHIYELNSVNEKLNERLTYWKNKINNNPQWDNAKKMINKYEFIFPSNSETSIDFMLKRPTSRAYFKLWEILHDLNMHQELNKYENLITCHLAEGPGGFIECICDFFNMYKIVPKKIYGITLISNDKRIPNWKIHKDYINNNPIHLNTYKSNYGNLYDVKSIDNFMKLVGNKSHFITADGGFDFSNDFNNQETSFSKLMVCEIYTALQIQEINGSFLLKVFDLFLENTIKIVTYCSLFYEKFIIIKPNTSRPANSEKYIMFQRFLPMNENTFEILEIFRNYIINETPIVFNEKNVKTYAYVSKCITEYNIFYTFNQMQSIKSTLECIETSTLNDLKTNDVIKQNIECCIEWCKTYNMCI